MFTEPEAWKEEWGADNLVFATEHCDKLPVIALGFLISHGLPRRIALKNPSVGNWEMTVSTEISFEPLFKPLRSFTTGMSWGDFYDAELDDDWSQQIVIGAEWSTQREASYCVHRLDETIKWIDLESEPPNYFVNSSLPQYGECLLLAVRWSKAIHEAGTSEWKSSLYRLADEIEAVDAEVFKQRYSQWSRLIEFALENEPGFLEITNG